MIGVLLIKVKDWLSDLLGEILKEHLPPHCITDRFPAGVFVHSTFISHSRVVFIATKWLVCYPVSSSNGHVCCWDIFTRGPFACDGFADLAADTYPIDMYSPHLGGSDDHANTTLIDPAARKHVQFEHEKRNSMLLRISFGWEETLEGKPRDDWVAWAVFRAPRLASLGLCVTATSCMLSEV